MQVVDILSPGRVAVARGDKQVTNKTDVLRLLSQLLASGEGTLEASAIEDLLARREGQQSTGVGGGVAIPHAAVEDLDRILGAVLLCPDPVKFDAVDGLPVSIFFAVIGPRRAVGEHLKTLARVSRLLRDDQFRERLVGASDGDAPFALIASEEGRPP